MLEPSGAAWVAQFPTSVSLDDLADPFRTNERAFLAALSAARARVSISATYRPPERAFLMHYCCLVAGYRDKAGAFHQIAPAAVPVMPGVDIDWTHGGDQGAAIAAAVAMRQAYGIAFPAALISRHTQRLAIDKTIAWDGTLVIADKSGGVHSIAEGPRSGMNPSLWKIGATFGVHKLASDPPHWSSDGH